MSNRVRITTDIPLEYWSGQDTPGVSYQNAPVDPEHTDELVVAIRSDDLETHPQERVVAGRPQIHFAGTPRALEAFGRYLIALARLQTLDADIHQHFEDVQNDDGGTVHLIVRRVASGGG